MDSTHNHNGCTSLLPQEGGGRCGLKSRRPVVLSCLVPAIAATILVSLLGAGAVFAEQEGPYIDIRKVAAITEGQAGYTELHGAYHITTTQIGARHYALVAAFADHGVQIIDITDPYNPTAVAAVSDGRSGHSNLYGASSIATTQIGARHYALVAAFGDDGVQIMDITNPSSPTAVAAIEDGATYPTLGGAQSVATTQIGSKHYALVAASNEDGVQIINITNPSSPTAVAAIKDGATYPTLGGAYSISTTQIGSKHYALVAALFDSGVQIIDITDPASPSPVASVTDGATYPTLGGAYSISTTQIGSKHYALVAATDENGVQIIDITDPASPSPVANVTDGATYPELYGAQSVTTTQINSRHYALVAAWGDDGVQMIDITDPASPSPVASAADSTTYTGHRVTRQCESGARCDSASDGAGYTELHGAASVTTTQIGSKHYALVAAFEDSGVQIIGIAQSVQQPQQPAPETETEERAPDAEEVWSAILSPYGAHDSSRGCWGDGDISGCHVNLHPHTFAYGGETYEAYLVALTTKGFLTVRFNNTLPGAQDATLVINGTSLDFDASTTKFPKWQYRLDWSDADSVAISLRINKDQETPEPTTTVTSTAPVITLKGSSQMTLLVGSTYTEPGYTATDREDGDLTASVTVTGSVDTARTGTYYLYYDVSDGSGNAAVRQVRAVGVVDRTAPVITLIGSSQMTLLVGSTYAELGYTATDNYDGDLTASVTVTGSVDTLQTGTYYLYYDVSDGSGNAAVRQARTVHVSAIPEPPQPEGAPTVVNPLPDVSLVGPETRVLSLSDVFRDTDRLVITVASSNYAAATMWVSSDHSTLTVVPIYTGTATITVTATDTDGNQVSDTFEVTVSPSSPE